MNDPFRTLLRALKALRINLLDSVDRAIEVIDHEEREGEALRQTYARDLTASIEAPTQALRQRGARDEFIIGDLFPAPSCPIRRDHA